MSDPVSPASSPRALRAACRAGAFDGPTSGFASGFVQGNIVILPSSHADAFARFCELNPGPCPLLEVLPAGDPEPARIAPGADVRHDLPRWSANLMRRFD